MITHANDAVGHFGLDLLVRAPDWLGPAAIIAATVPGPSKVNDSGAVDVDQDFALAHPKDDGFVGFGAGIPLTVHHAPGDAYEVARSALDALGATGTELQSQAALRLEHVGVVARLESLEVV